MVRYLTAAVLGCLYVAGSIWLVQSEGRTYRDGLRTPKLTRKAIENATPADVEGDAKPAPIAAAVAPAASQPKLAAVKSAPAANQARSTIPPNRPSPAPPPKTELAAARPSTASATDRRAARAGGAAAQSTNSLGNDPFWSQPALMRNWDLAVLKADDELRLGADLHDVIVQLNPLIEDGPWLSRVEDAALPFIKTLRRKEITYKFFILNSDAVNAFSTPGGYVYVSRGLFDLIGEDDDDALQFAIGHEIAHVDLEHAIRCLRDPGVQKMTQGTLQKLYWLILPFGYLATDTVDQEFEADRWAAVRMQGLGRTRREILVFLQKMDGYARGHGFGDGRGRPQPGRDLSPLENHYRAQTAARKRLRHLKEFLDSSSKDAK
jgi:hypothetical protein